jgi:predicted nucleotidyltransferase
MGVPSKEDAIVDLFFSEPTRQWHFDDIVRKSGVSRSKANKWLVKLVREGIIVRVKPNGKMPYFQGSFDNPAYRNRKRVYALLRFYRTGFLDHLVALPKAKTVILFGSFSRADWYAGSDIDVFIFGSDEGLDERRFAKVLGHEIQVFSASDQKGLSRLGPDLLRNILEGTLIKGKIDFVRVMPHVEI